jgi:RNA polymerase subunit RPABC4/transcription elongation factor Spt4
MVEKHCTKCGAEFMIMSEDFNICGYCKTPTLVTKGAKKWWEFWK